MTRDADKNGYHFVTKAAEPNITESVTTDSSGKTIISAQPGGTFAYDASSKTVVMDAGNGITLNVAYSDDAQKTGETVIGTVNSITANYTLIMKVNSYHWEFISPEIIPGS